MPFSFAKPVSAGLFTSVSHISRDVLVCRHTVAVISKKNITLFCWMAPEATNILFSRTSLQSEASLDVNNNMMKAAQNAVKRPATSAEDLNAKSRKLIKNCFSNLRSNLNILVVGVKESGEFVVIELS